MYKYTCVCTYASMTSVNIYMRRVQQMGVTVLQCVHHPSVRHLFFRVASKKRKIAGHCSRRCAHKRLLLAGQHRTSISFDSRTARKTTSFCMSSSRTRFFFFTSRWNEVSIYLFEKWLWELSDFHLGTFIMTLEEIKVWSIAAVANVYYVIFLCLMRVTVAGKKKFAQQSVTKNIQTDTKIF